MVLVILHNTNHTNHNNNANHNNNNSNDNMAQTHAASPSLGRTSRHASLIMIVLKW